MMVSATGLRKAYGSNVVLDGLDLSVARGSVFALLGPNGAGKTTMVRILTTLLRPDAGQVTVAGYDVVAEPAKVRGAISLAGQAAAVDKEQTGRENLVMAGQLMHLGRGPARTRAAELLERFGLTGAMNRRVRTYSGGMSRRLDLAMSLVGNPGVIFLDEPTTGLDPASRTAVWDAITELAREGTTIVLTTQYLEEADHLADHLAVLHNGQVAASGTADTLKSLVGGDRLDLWFADQRALNRAAERFAAAGAIANQERRTIALPSDGSAQHLHQTLDALRGADIAVDRVTSHRPTLDDVFMTLTSDTPNPRTREAAGLPQ